MVSGIGPEDKLQSLGIPVIAALSGVGANFSDQPGFGIGYPVNVSKQHQLYSNATYAAEAQETFVQNQTGPLTAFGSNYIAWEHFPESTYANLSSAARAELSNFPADWPDIQYILSGVGIVSNMTGNYIAVGVNLMKATSRGCLTINSTDTAVNPVVDVNWLATSTDQQVAVTGVRRARVFADSFGVISGPEVLPGPSVQSYADILAYIKEAAGPSHHVVGTCKMGKPQDPGAVVDTQCRVLGGIFGLRVVDASTMPLLPPGQPMATVYMLAEKFAVNILSGSSMETAYCIGYFTPGGSLWSRTRTALVSSHDKIMLLLLLLLFQQEVV
ncbi:GMC oxidoreductase [Viridothelium virens]|uniref:GMC oxidoreductase n=1 Tax=Viridothelium virens TaxID=1048519 RepID=A0A6A6GWG1_VIRVR|nr:GMC oxidoreductase [Viridothelium virens]